MADIIKSSNTLDVTLNDSQGKETIFKIDEPKSSITRQQVNDVFNPMIQSGIYYSRHGNPFSNIKSAVTVQTTIRTKELN